MQYRYKDTLAEKYPVLGSSADPQKVSMTFKGLAMWTVPAIIAIGSYYGMDIAETDIVTLINNITVAIASVLVVVGGARKLWFKYKK